MISIPPIGACDAKAGDIRFPTLAMDLGRPGLALQRLGVSFNFQEPSYA